MRNPPHAGAYSFYARLREVTRWIDTWESNYWLWLRNYAILPSMVRKNRKVLAEGVAATIQHNSSPEESPCVIKAESRESLATHHCDSDAAHFWSRVAKAGPDECWLWQGYVNKNGYGEYRAPRSYVERTHRVAYELTHGIRVLPHGLVIRHTCDTPLCCNPKHLVDGTHSDNVADRVTRDRSAKGTRNGRAKLSENAVRAIRASAYGASHLAHVHGVDPKTIRSILERHTWKHIR